MAKKEKGASSSNIQLLPKMTDWAQTMRNEAFNQFPGSEEDEERIIYTLYCWSDRADALELESFCFEHGYWRDWLWNWGQRSEKVKQAIDRVKIRLAHRRRMGCLTKKFDNATVFRSLWRYDPEEAENDNREDERKIKVAAAVAKARVEADKGAGNEKINVIVTWPDAEQKGGTKQC